MAIHRMPRSRATCPKTTPCLRERAVSYKELHTSWNNRYQSIAPSQYRPTHFAITDLCPVQLILLNG